MQEIEVMWKLVSKIQYRSWRDSGDDVGVALTDNADSISTEFNNMIRQSAALCETASRRLQSRVGYSHGLTTEIKSCRMEPLP